MKKEIFIKGEHEKYKTLIDLRGHLNLPSDIKLSDDELVDFIDNMENPDYKEIITYRYILGYSFKEIEESIDLFYVSLESLCKTAVRNLRKDIIDYFHPIDYNDLPVHDIVWHKISNRLGLTGKTVKEAKEWLLTFEYPPSKDVDILVEAISKLDPDFHYPKYLLNNPPYPYNLYSYLLKERLRKGVTVRTIYSKYMIKIARNPNNNFYAYYNHADEIFSEGNFFMRLFLNDRDLNIVKMYFKDNLSTQEISAFLLTPESTIKSAVYKVVDLLNTDIGAQYIHNGFPIK